MIHEITFHPPRYVFFVLDGMISDLVSMALVMPFLSNRTKTH